MTSSRPEQRKFASPSSQMTSSRCRDKSVNEVHAAAPPEKKNEILEDGSCLIKVLRVGVGKGSN